jgi:hypothetical protein
MTDTLPIAREPEVQRLDDGLRAMQTWALPTDEAFLSEFLSYVFQTYWDQIVFGPIIEGAAYEWTCPNAPTTCRVFDGYLTVAFGGPHFHLCVGENKGPPRDPTPEALRQRRKPSKAWIFRRLDKNGAPLSWGFEMQNGAGEPMVSIFFASPFLMAGDKVLKKPQWERLAMWRDISSRYLGRPPEAFDESGRGFAGGHG